jgi:hypothetical protein
MKNALKLILMVTVNVFAGCVIASLLFRERQPGNVIMPPAWVMWPLQISMGVLVVLFIVGVSYYLNSMLFKLLFSNSQLIQKGIPPMRSPPPPPKYNNRTELLVGFIETSRIRDPALPPTPVSLQAKNWMNAFRIRPDEPAAIVLRELEQYYGFDAPEPVHPPSRPTPPRDKPQPG